MQDNEDDHLSIEATLGIWSELLAARRGKNGYGGTVAEIYAYRLVPAALSAADVTGGVVYAARAAANLTTILRRFQSAYPSCKIGIEEGPREFRTLDLATETIPPFDHRIHIEVLDATAKDANHHHNKIRRELLTTLSSPPEPRLSVEATLLLVEAVDRLTAAVDEHGGKIATAIDYISDHLPGDR